MSLRRPRSRPIAIRLLVFSLVLLTHGAMLAALGASRSPELPPPELPPLLISLAGSGGGGEPAPAPAPSPAEPSARPAPAQPTQPEMTDPEPPQADPPQLDGYKPALETPDQPVEEPAISDEFLAVMAEGLQLDREPDPAATGDGVMAAAPGPPGQPGVDCPLVGVLRDTLEQDAAVQASLARIPPRSRSVAGAVMLWDGAWIDPDRIGGPATIDSVRAVIAASLQASSEPCRTQVVVGPVFLPVRSRSGTLVLALGSGQWRWSDLLEPQLPAPPPPARRFWFDRLR